MGKFLLSVALVLTCVQFSYSAVNIIDIYKDIVFDFAVMKNPKPVVVLYYSSSSCAACKWSIKPMLEKMARRKSDKMYLALVDFDKVPNLQASHGIQEIPTTRVYYKGQMLDSVEGLSWAKLVPLVNGAAKIQD